MKIFSKSIPFYLVIYLIAFTFLACRPNRRRPETDAPQTKVKVTADDAPGALTADENSGENIPSSQRIVPGMRSGGTVLNESSKTVYQRLGKQDEGDAAMGKSVSMWYAGHSRTSSVIQILFARKTVDDTVSHVKSIRVSSPDFKINNELYTGAPLENAEKVYKLVKTGAFRDNGNDRDILDDNASGIAFDADRNGRITGITVYEPGKNGLEAYKAFFTLKELNTIGAK